MTTAPEALRPPSGTPDVFISYASQDAAVADAVVGALERAGLKCWVAPRDVVPGALYADEIVGAINDAKVIVLILSEAAAASSHVGKELERASSKRRRIIALRTGAASLPRSFEYFLSESQWIEVGSGGIEAAAAKLVDAVQRHLAPPSATEPSVALAPPILDRKVAAPRGRWVIGVSGALIALALAYFVVDKFWISKRAGGAPAASTPATAAPTAAATFAPPPHSIAVLPFVNMSGDSQQDYFSDGLSEELLNSLSRITALQVAARTSSFSFKGKQVDVADIAHKLNVGAILEGSVRRDGAHLRITAQLINAVTGFHLWSQTYDRDLRHILALQTEIASAVTSALQATLLSDSAALIELGGTQNPQAFDAYLRARKVYAAGEKDSVLRAIAGYSEAIRLDPRYAKAYAAKAVALTDFASRVINGPAIRESYEQARAMAEKALALAPELGEAHTAFASVLDQGFADYVRAGAEYDRALALSPGNIRVLGASASFFSNIGRFEAAIANAQRAVVLDPLNPNSHIVLSRVLYNARRDREAIEAYRRGLSLSPNPRAEPLGQMGLVYVSLGEFEVARQTCATPPLDWVSNTCLAIVYHKLHRQSDADAALATLRAAEGDDAAYQYADIYAQWGNFPKALEWLEAAYRTHDPGLIEVKVDPMLDPLRKEPRFKEIERKLKFPH